MAKPAKSQHGGLRSNEIGRRARELRAYDRLNGYTPALVEQVKRLITKTPARDYPVYFTRYSKSYRLELVSAPGGIVMAVDIVNNATNECFAGWVATADSLAAAAGLVDRGRHE